MKRAILAAIPLFLWQNAALRAEEIQLKDGTKLSGKIVAAADDSFQIKTSYGEVRVQRAQIVSINFPENQAGASSEHDSGVPIAVDESLEGTAYTNRTAHFQLKVPNGWMTSETMRNQSKDIIAALVSKDQTQFLFVTPEKFAGTFDTYRVLAENQFQMKFKDYEKLSESESRLDGRTGTRIVWRGKSSSNGAPLKFLVFIVPYDGRMVRLAFFTLEPLFDTALPTFDQIASTYRSTAP